MLIEKDLHLVRAETELVEECRNVETKDRPDNDGLVCAADVVSKGEQRKRPRL